MSYSSNQCFCCGSNIGTTHPIDGVYVSSTHCTCGDSYYEWINDTACAGVCSYTSTRQARSRRSLKSVRPSYCTASTVSPRECSPNSCYNLITSNDAKTIPLSIQVTDKNFPYEMYCLSKNSKEGNGDGKLNDIGVNICNDKNCSQRFAAYDHGNRYTFKYIGCDTNGNYRTGKNSPAQNNNIGKFLEIDNGMDGIWSGKLELQDGDINNYKRIFKMNVGEFNAYFKGDGGRDHTRKLRNYHDEWYTLDNLEHGTEDNYADGSEIHFLRR
jgi:hypothetical protein